LRDQLIAKGVELLDVEENILIMALDDMIRVKDVIIEKNVIQLPRRIMGRFQPMPSISRRSISLNWVSPGNSRRSSG